MLRRVVACPVVSRRPVVVLRRVVVVVLRRQVVILRRQVVVLRRQVVILRRRGWSCGAWWFWSGWCARWSRYATVGGGVPGGLATPGDQVMVLRRVVVVQRS